MEGHDLPDLFGDVLEVGPVADGQNHLFEAGPVCGKHLLLDATDREHPALQGDLPGHAHGGAHRDITQQADQGRGHGHSGRGPVLGNGAGRDVQVKALSGEDLRVDAEFLGV